MEFDICEELGKPISAAKKSIEELAKEIKELAEEDEKRRLEREKEPKYKKLPLYIAFDFICKNGFPCDSIIGHDKDGNLLIMLFDVGAFPTVMRVATSSVLKKGDRYFFTDKIKEAWDKAFDE